MAGTVFATGGFHGLNYVEEQEFGITPNSPLMTALRHTSCSLVLTKDTFQSEELRPDAQVMDLRHGTRQTSGDIGFEFSYGEFEEFLSAAVRSRFVAEGDNRRLVTGIEQRSFTLERVFSDITQYERFTGCMINSFSLSISANAMVTGTIGIIGSDASFAQVPLNIDPAASQAYSPFDSFTGQILEGGSDIATITSIEFTIDNGIEPAFVVGKNSAAAMLPSRIVITGTLSLYFQNLDMLNKFYNEEDSTIVFTLGDGQRQSYTFTFPRVKYSSGENPTDGDGAIVLSMGFQSVYDPCTGQSFDVLSIPGPAAGPCVLTYSGTAFNESSVNPGTLTDVHTVDLSGGNGDKYFAGNVGQEIPGAAISDVPDGLTAHVIKVSNTQARISFTGVADDPIAATTMTITFTARSFTFGTCGCPGGTIQNMVQSLTIVPA